MKKTKEKSLCNVPGKLTAKTFFSQYCVTNLITIYYTILTQKRQEK